MIYYFVSRDGEYLEIEDAPRGYFSKQRNPNMRTNKREAERLQKQMLKARIAELQKILEELE